MIAVGFSMLVLCIAVSLLTPDSVVVPYTPCTTKEKWILGSWMTGLIIGLLLLIVGFIKFLWMYLP